MTTESTGTVPANGTPSGGELLAGQSRAARIVATTRAARDEVRSALLAGADLEPTPDAVKPETKPEKTSEAAPDAAGTVEEPAAGVASETSAAADRPDAETEKRLAAVQAADKRNREKLAKEREEVAAERAAAAKERAEIAAEREAVAAWRKAQERAKVDPVGYLCAAGVTDPDALEYAARQAYGAAKGDPANKEAAARALRERELAGEVADLKRWRAEREQAEKQQAESVRVEREVAAYVDTLVKTAKTAEDAPLAKHFMAKSPEKTLHRLRLIAAELAHETGDVPDHADVVARFEKTRRAELEDYGVNIDSILKTEQKKPDPPAAEKTAAKTLENTMSTPRVPRSSTSEREARAEARAELLKLP